MAISDDMSTVRWNSKSWKKLLHHDFLSKMLTTPLSSDYLVSVGVVAEERLYRWS